MIQQRKKDYLQRLIEDFFVKLQQFQQDGDNPDEGKKIVNDCLAFFQTHLNTLQSDSSAILIQKIENPDLLEQYARILLKKYEIVDIKETDQLHVALDIVENLEISDNTYSWNRNILKEDLLRLLDQNNDPHP